VAEFRNGECVGDDSYTAIKQLQQFGYNTAILSGDCINAVDRIAVMLGIDRFRASMDPSSKAEHVVALQSVGNVTLFIGDGINDLPALSAADIAMVPGTAADIGRDAADIVYTHQSLMAVPKVLILAKNATRLMRQNLWLSIVYNLLAVPAAAMGFITPMWAAILMSSSSLLVIGNSIRLKLPELNNLKNPVSRESTSQLPVMSS